MSEPPAERSLPEPVVGPRRGISLVWLIPLVAAAVGGWLAYRTISEQGSTIVIEFRDGSGLEAGKTPIKYKAVDVGEVSRIGLADDLSTVRVEAEMDRKMSPYLTASTRFWIVRPRVGVTGVSGLGTLVSGAYIEIEPGRGQEQRHFVGLESPPIVSATEQGRRFVLESESLGSLTAGSPLYYRSIPVGQVLGHELSDDERKVLVHVFVRAPFDSLVTDRSRFWNVSGFEVSVGAEGVDLRVGSLPALLTGGVAFDSPTDGRRPSPSGEGAHFRLYSSLRELEAAGPPRPLTYALYFQGSVRGLQRGAPVEFRGIKVGAVKDVSMEIDGADLTVRIPVVVEIDPRRIKTTGDLGKAGPEQTVAALVERGLRARLRTASLLTGQRFVDIGLHDDVPPAKVGFDGTHAVLPTVPSTMEQFERSAQDVLAQIGRLPLEELTNQLVGAARGANRLMNSPDTMRMTQEARAALEAYRALAQDIGKQVDPVARSVESASAAARDALGAAEPGSELRYGLSSTLKELAAAARSLRILAEYLERHPEALILGRSREGR